METLPESVDWSSYFGPVRDQKRCDSCWAMTACACAEALYNIKHTRRPLKPLAPQHLINCVNPGWKHKTIMDKKTGGQRNVECYPCKISAAFKYMRDEGVKFEADCPYEAKKRDCLPKEHDNCKRFRIKDFVRIPSEDANGNFNEERLMRELTIHPLAAAILVYEEFVELKGTGIFMGTGEIINTDNDTIAYHALAIVGYGTESSVNYWKVRCSWGDTWGDKGYAKVVRQSNHPNQISLVSRFSYPVVY